MQIFALDKDPVVSAQLHCDKHVIKMITESCQIISTVLKLEGIDVPDYFYKVTHKNHPAMKWVSESRANLKWLCELAKALIVEYELRYKKSGKYVNARKIISWCEDNLDLSGELTPFKLMMDEKYQTKDPIESYHKFYVYEKLKFAKWTHREVVVDGEHLVLVRTNSCNSI